MTHKVTVNRLKQIIKEELAHKRLLENVDFEGNKVVVNGAAALLKAITNFESSATPHMINALTPELSGIKETLEQMVDMPGSFVEKKPLERKKVVLNPAGKSTSSANSAVSVD